MDVTGGCLCGAVVFTVSGIGRNIYQCHCSLCRKQGGSASNSGTVVPLEKLEWTNGREHVTAWRKESGFSSSFCSHCGSPVPNQLRGSDYYWIPVGTLEDALMQAIAMENNLSETAFFVPTDRGFHLRWFTPAAEVKLCGHATLATAHVIFEHLNYSADTITFETLSGELKVVKNDNLLTMDFPATPPSPCTIPAALTQALGREPVEVLAEDDYLVLLESEADLLAIEPDMALLKQLDRRGVIVSAPGDNVDFVSRFFAPKYGIDEDPVTGSAHCILTPYWVDKLGKNILDARQVSKRGGDIRCELKGDRVALSGRAITFMQAEIYMEKLQQR